MEYRKYGSLEEWGNLNKVNDNCYEFVPIVVIEKAHNLRHYWIKWIVRHYKDDEDWADVNEFEDYESAKAFALNIVNV